MSCGRKSTKNQENEIFKAEWCLITVAAGLKRVNHIYCPSTPFPLWFSLFLPSLLPLPRQSKTPNSSPEAALETTELMDLLVLEPCANAAIKCPTDLFAVQTPIYSYTQRSGLLIHTTHQSWMLLQESLIQCQAESESEHTGKCKHPPGDSRAALEFKKCSQDGKSFSPWPGCKIYSTSWHASKLNLNPLSRFST